LQSSGWLSLLLLLLLVVPGSSPHPTAGVHPGATPAPSGSPGHYKPYDPTTCSDKLGPTIYAADQPDVVVTNAAGPPLVMPPVHATDADFAVISLWIALCVDPVNTAQFVVAFDGGHGNPLVRYNTRQWGTALDHLRACGDWTGQFHQPTIVHRGLPRSWATDYMVPHQLNGVPAVGYEHNPNGVSDYLRVYDICTMGYVFVRVQCMQPIGPHAPPDYLTATAGRLQVSVTPKRTTSAS
jgi:hypothetical protein